MTITNFNSSGDPHSLVQEHLHSMGGLFPYTIAVGRLDVPDRTVLLSDYLDALRTHQYIRLRLDDGPTALAAATLETLSGAPLLSVPPGTLFYVELDPGTDALVRLKQGARYWMAHGRFNERLLATFEYRGTLHLRKVVAYSTLSAGVTVDWRERYSHPAFRPPEQRVIPPESILRRCISTGQFSTIGGAAPDTAVQYWDVKGTWALRYANGGSIITYWSESPGVHAQELVASQPYHMYVTTLADATNSGYWSLTGVRNRRHTLYGTRGTNTSHLLAADGVSFLWGRVSSPGNAITAATGGFNGDTTRDRICWCPNYVAEGEGAFVALPSTGTKYVHTMPLSGLAWVRGVDLSAHYTGGPIAADPWGNVLLVDNATGKYSYYDVQTRTWTLNALLGTLATNAQLVFWCPLKGFVVAASSGEIFHTSIGVTKAAADYAFYAMAEQATLSPAAVEGCSIEGAWVLRQGNAVRVYRNAGASAGSGPYDDLGISTTQYPTGFVNNLDASADGVVVLHANGVNGRYFVSHYAYPEVDQLPY